MSEGIYRLGVGLMIINTDKKIWMGKRVNSDGWKYQWQMPQGGIEGDKDPLQTAWRELWEETGLTQKNVKLLAEAPEWTEYVFPPELGELKTPFIGQRQKWFLLQLTGTDQDIDFTAHQPAEFDTFKWVEASDVLALAVPFKKHVYQQALDMFKEWL